MIYFFFVVASTPGPQPVSMVKTQKKQRKEGTNDFENTSRDRDDVQSPAYSDISDDSTPVAESEISGKLHTLSFPILLLSLYFTHCIYAHLYTYMHEFKTNQKKKKTNCTEVLRCIKFEFKQNKNLNCVGMFKDKNQAVKHPADILPKKVGETLPPQSSQMGYGIYHFCECEYFTQDVTTIRMIHRRTIIKMNQPI